MKFSRRKAIQAFGASAMFPLAARDQSFAAQVPAPPKEGENTPKIAVGMGDGGAGSAGRGPNADRTIAPRRIKQLGVDHVLSGAREHFRGQRKVLPR
jgi:hypothetical protein